MKNPPLKSKLSNLFIDTSFRATIFRGSFGSLLLKATHAIIAFSIAITLARVLGPEGYGIYSFSLALLLFAAIPSKAGLPQLLVRETAKAKATGDWELIAGLWRWTTIVAIIFSAIAIAAVVIISLFTTTGPLSSRSTTLLNGAALIPILALTSIIAANLRGLSRVIVGQLSETFFRPILLLIFIVIWINLPSSFNDLTPEITILLHASAALASFLLTASMLHLVQPSDLKNVAHATYHTKTWRRAVLPLTMITALQLTNNYADLLTLGLMRTNHEVGIYRAVFQIALLIIFGLQAVNQALHPHLASLYHQDQHQKLQNLVTISARVIFLMALPFFLIFILQGDTLLELLFGVEYRAGWGALSILAFGQLINASMGSVGALLNMTGNETSTMTGVGIAAVTNILLNIILIPPYGLEGAATATTISTITWNFILRKAVLKNLNLEPSVLSKNLLKR